MSSGTAQPMSAAGHFAHHARILDLVDRRVVEAVLGQRFSSRIAWKDGHAGQRVGESPVDRGGGEGRVEVSDHGACGLCSPYISRSVWPIATTA